MDKIKNQLQVSVSNDGFVDEGEGVVSFPNGLTITDDTTMRSGTSYDINSLGISTYAGQLTADHQDSLGTLIGKTIGVAKEGNRVFVSAIKYAVKENPYARLAYDLLVGGFSNSFSIETIGAPASSADPVYRNHELVGLSQVVVPNNYNAKINQFNEIVHNSLERSQQDGLDITGVEEKIFSSVELKSSESVEEESMKDKDVNASEELAKAPEIEETSTVETVENEAEVVETEATEVQETVEEAEQVESEVEVDNGKWVDTEVVATTRTSEYVETEEEKASRQAERIAYLEAELAAVKAKEVSGDEEDITVTVKIDTDNEAEDKVENEAPVEETEAEVEAEEVETAENNTNKNEETLEMTAEQIAEIVANAIKPLTEDLAATRELAQNALDSQAKEPEFVEAEEAKNSYDDLSSDELFAKQLNAAVAVERFQSVEGAATLREINARNLEALKSEKIVNRALTLEDLGNFVVGPELYKEIVGVRTDYTAILDATTWKETNSLEFGWLTRGNDIDMSNVAIGALGDVPSPDTTDNRLKPVSTPGYGAHTDKLEELAAVTPISINTIKFAAVDILSDIAEGYRNDYDRKRAQLVIARLQQAVNTTGNKQAFDISEGLDGWALVVAKISDATSIGTLVFNSKTLAALKSQAIKSQNAAILTEIASGSILGTPFILVPNDLLPTLNTTETKSFEVHGSPVTIDTAVFYGDLRTFTGRTSGGLKYDVDGSASYEIGGETYSAYQRNEVVLRGSFFRGGVVKDPSVIASIPAVAVS